MEEVLVIFTRDFDWREPGSAFTIAYKAGMNVFVDDACAEAAFSRGVAIPSEDDPLYVPDSADDVLAILDPGFDDEDAYAEDDQD